MEKREPSRDVADVLNEVFGTGTVVRLDDAFVQDVSVVSTGSIGLDRALGVGGLPRGRIVEVYGPESGGKTTLCLHVIANAQAAGDVCMFVDAEHALDVNYARALGVRLSDLLVSQPDNGEQALAIVDAAARTRVVKVIVVDSVAALVPKAELDGDMGDVHVGLQARLMSQAMRKLASVASVADTLVVFINQLRHKIGVRFGSPETTTGGNALKYYASVRLDIRRVGQVKQGEAKVGNRTRVKVAKNKVAAPFREVEFDIDYGTGISRLGELIEIGVELKVVEKSGAWLSYKGERIGQGLSNSKAFLAKHPEVAAAIEEEVRAK